VIRRGESAGRLFEQIGKVFKSQGAYLRKTNTKEVWDEHTVKIHE
jgi:hypothetical protein